MMNENMPSYLFLVFFSLKFTRPVVKTTDSISDNWTTHRYEGRSKFIISYQHFIEFQQKFKLRRPSLAKMLLFECTLANPWRIIHSHTLAIASKSRGENKKRIHSSFFRLRSLRSLAVLANLFTFIARRVAARISARRSAREDRTDVFADVRAHNTPRAHQIAKTAKSRGAANDGKARQRTNVQPSKAAGRVELRVEGWKHYLSRSTTHHLRMSAAPLSPLLYNGTTDTEVEAHVRTMSHM